MKAGCWIGNDVVDLAEAGVAGKERDARFMTRVFTPMERARILQDAMPTVALWKAWSAKESAYKVARKIREAVVFAHQAFEVTLSAPHAGIVRFEDLAVRVWWELGPGYIHCVGEMMSGTTSPAPPPGNGSRHHFLSAVVDDAEWLDGTLTSAERASVHSPASERARLLARTVVERWGVGAAEIVRWWRRSGWSAPIVARRGRRVEGFDVSLSHDGRFVAAAVSGPVRE